MSKCIVKTLLKGPEYLNLTSRAQRWLGQRSQPSFWSLLAFLEGQMVNILGFAEGIEYLSHILFLSFF